MGNVHACHTHIAGASQTSTCLAAIAEHSRVQCTPVQPPLGAQHVRAYEAGWQAQFFPTDLLCVKASRYLVGSKVRLQNKQPITCVVNRVGLKPDTLLYTLS